MLAASVVLLSSAMGHATPELSDEEIRRLETLSGLGKEACQQEDWESCHRMFAEAEDLLPWAPHEFYLGQALVGMGRLLEGVALWEKILKDNPSPSDPIVEQTTQAARERLSEVRSQIPKLQFELAPEHQGQVQIRLDGRLLEADEHTRVFELDPGHHVVQMAQSGFTRERHDLEFQRAQHKRLAVALTPLQIEARAPESATPEPTIVVASDKHWRPIAGWTIVTVGALSTVAGAVTYSLKQDRNEALERDCGGSSVERCVGLSESEYDARVDRIEDRTLVSNALLFGGGGLLGVGAGLLLWDALADDSQADDPAQDTAARWHATVGRESAWVSVTSHF